jgi:nucleoside-diphosphate-sugar epimerase
MKILVTGGAGYKGIKLTTRLLQAGHCVTVFDNFMYGYEPIIHLVENPNLTIVKRDIRNGVDEIGQYDAVFHLAGISGFPACANNPNSAHLINVDATRKLVTGLGRDQILIYASTTSIYGKKGEVSREDDLVDPVSTYAMTKYEAEKIVNERENSVSLRFATVFGVSPKMRIDLMINDFTYRAFKEGALVLFDGFAVRTFIHIDDAVDCYLFALDNYNRMKGGVYNAGGETLNYSKRQIADIIRKYAKYDIIDSEIRDKDLRHFIVSYEKIASLGFFPKRDVETGVKQLMQLYSFYEVFSPFKVI